MANAGRLEPGATYVYEKADGVTYARKVGDPPDARFEIGRDYDSKKLHQDLMHSKLWGQIHRANVDCIPQKWLHIHRQRFWGWDD
jgi:hypothetical protein